MLARQSREMNMLRTPKDQAKKTVMLYAFSADGSSFPGQVGLEMKESVMSEARHVNRMDGTNACHAYIDEIMRILSTKVKYSDPTQHDFAITALNALIADEQTRKACQGNGR
jgi:hypothetical protein